MTLTIGRCSTTLTIMKGKGRLIAELEQAAQSMVQGSLSEVTRQCGDPSCACAWDPTRRHGPHLYLKFSADGKAHSVYVPPEQGHTLKDAHRAWVRFQEIGVQVAADNRERFLQALIATNRWSRRGGPRHARRHDVIELCRRQLNFADGLIAEEVGELWEDWMRHMIRCSPTRSCWLWSTRRWRAAGRTVARAGARANRRTFSGASGCSSCSHRWRNC